MQKFIRIQRAMAPAPNSAERSWKTVPNCHKVPVWNMSVADTVVSDNERSAKRFYFHTPFVEGIEPGNLVTYLSEHFTVLEVSDSAGVRGLELGCEAVVAGKTT